MPWGDGTGPAGYGPRSGRGMGYCAGVNAPNAEYGRRLGRGRGRGFGRGLGWYGRYAQPTGPTACPPAANVNYSPPAPDEELRYLREGRSALQDELKGLEERIKELEAKLKDSKQ